MSTKYLLAGFIAVSGFIGLATVEGASAESVRERIGQYSAQREDARAERHAERSAHQSQLPNRLSDAVSEGTLTEDQKSLLLQKHEDMQSERELWREEKATMTPDERRAAAEERRQEMQQWAEQNDIPTEFVAQGQRDRAEHKFGNGNGMRWQQ